MHIANEPLDAELFFICTKVETHQKSLHEVKDDMKAVEDEFNQLHETDLPTAIDKAATRAV